MCPLQTEWLLATASIRREQLLRCAEERHARGRRWRGFFGAGGSRTHGCLGTYRVGRGVLLLGADGGTRSLGGVEGRLATDDGLTRATGAGAADAATDLGLRIPVLRHFELVCLAGLEVCWWGLCLFGEGLFAVCDEERLVKKLVSMEIVAKDDARGSGTDWPAS